MNILVLAQAYPVPNGKRPLYYIHSRNLYYQKNGINVTVLNFSAEKGYVYDGIKVLSLSEYISSDEHYDILLCHAANIRSHYRFLKKYDSRFERIVFFFHGHEILHLNKYYPPPYPYMKQKRLRRFLQNYYDDFKLKTWHNYFLKNINSIKLVFVSHWIYHQFLSELRFHKKEVEKNVVIIPNSIGKFFEENKYQPDAVKYDFITIRSYLDDSNYSIDIVVNLAEHMPNYQFCLIGNGRYFEYHKKPDNITWLKGEHPHEKLAELINQSRYALMPTREDTHGLMACELAAYGIPLITSDIEICHEVFSDCPRTAFINNENPNLEQAVEKLRNADNSEWTRFYAENTIMKEIKLLKSFC